jgi:GNAT superfamily N-acetyltransferase
MHETPPRPPAVAAGPLVFAVEDPAVDPAAAALLAAMEAELVEINRGRPGRPLATAELSGPSGTYLVARVGDDPVAGGGLRRLGDEMAEIKRMYVRPEARGRGIAAALLEALEAAAVELGYRTVRLDTGPHQAHAQRLYERCGYRSIPDYNGNDLASFWGEKHLGTPPA